MTHPPNVIITEAIKKKKKKNNLTESILDKIAMETDFFSFFFLRHTIEHFRRFLI